MEEKVALPPGLILRGSTYHVRFEMKGQLIAESTKTKNLRDAIRYLTKRKAEVQQDMMLNGIRIAKLHDAMDLFLKSYVSEAAARPPRQALDKFKAIPNLPLKQVDLPLIEEVIKAMHGKYSKATIGTHISYWNAFSNWCVKNKYHQPPKLQRKNTTVHRERWLTPEEQAKLLAALNPANNKQKKRDEGKVLAQERHDFIVMLLDTGLRFTEASKMKWTQVDLDKNALYVVRNKNGAPATLTITTRLKELLVARKNADAVYVFPKMANQPMNGTRWLKQALQQAGISEAEGKISPHTMRHTFASTMIQNGLALNEVQHLLGHANIQMTTRYAKFRKQDATDKAAEIMNRIAAQVEVQPVSNVVTLRG